ncbi:MAG: tRNA (adenosine(37)-N6)-threonylcarbamoyltransferase complex transferase subunit TsaD [Planctomycetota bacterium]
MLILGLETSCDETAASVVEDGIKVRSSVVASQVAAHAPFGGVVPEIASRRHLSSLPAVMEAAMKEAGAGFPDIGAFAVARSPGLIGALMVGVTAARTLAWAFQKPLAAVNHVEAHIWANALALGLPLPEEAVALVVSGGHTSLYRLGAGGTVRCLGKTRDDAAGESFDKVASILGLGYPGGPFIERAAKTGNPKACEMPRARLEPGSLDFSFSGLKTACLYAFKGQPGRKRAVALHRAEDVAASFQESVVDVLVEKAMRAAEQEGLRTVLVGGGVACNGRLRERMFAEGVRRGVEVRYPPPALCTDNAAMIAGLAFEKLRRGEASALDTVASPSNEFEA